MILKLAMKKPERIVTEIQLAELHRIAGGMVEDGLLEITEYDGDGQPVYKPTEKGLSLIKV